MKRTLIALVALAATVSTPALAGGSAHQHYCNCGHTAGSKSCGGSSSSSTSSTSSSSTSSSSGGSTSSGGASSSGGSSSSTSSTGGTTTSSTSSGGTKVPEPGMLGLMGLTLVGMGVTRRRRAAVRA